MIIAATVTGLGDLPLRFGGQEVHAISLPTPTPTDPEGLQPIANRSNTDTLTARDLELLFEMPVEDGRSLQYIFPPDDRTRVSPTDRRVAYIESWFDDGDGYIDSGDDFSGCTAYVIGARILMTAAHCIYNAQLGGWPDGVGIFPGADGGTYPLGLYWAEWMYVPRGWPSSAHPLYDFGFITLRHQDKLPGSIGAYPLAVLPDSSLAAPDLWATTIGYPADKPGITQWKSSIASLLGFDENYVYSELDYTYGQSGSGIFRKRDSGIFAVLTGGFVQNGREVNYGRRINSEVLTFAQGVCQDVGCSFAHFIEKEQPTPTPSPTPTPTPSPTATPSPTPSPTESPTSTPTQPPPPPTQSPQPSPTASPTQNPQPSPTASPTQSPQPSPTASAPPVSGDLTALQRTWQRTDLPVFSGQVSRTWMWGPSANTPVITEAYEDSPGGIRQVQYYDKSRMEISDPAGDPTTEWYVTNGLLVRELITGQMQIGDDSFESRGTALINVAGDPDDPTGPMYASFAELLDAAPLPAGSVITQIVDRAGSVSSDVSLAGHGVTSAFYVPETNHGVASVFWEFMNSEGMIFENGQLVHGSLFSNPFYATGYPITEPYWASVKVAGEYRWVLIQVFERRVLTYTPGNPEGFAVEAGNVGQHYYRWRYGS